MATTHTKVQQKDYADRIRNVCKQRQTSSDSIIQLFARLINEDKQKNNKMKASQSSAV